MISPPKDIFIKLVKNKLILLLSLCIGISFSPIVLLMYGLGSFKVSGLVGDKNVTEWFSYCSAVVSLVMIIVGPSSGYIADRLSFRFGSRKFCILGGSIIGGLSLLGFSISSNITSLILCWIFAQFGYGLVGAACFAMIASNVENKFLGRAYSLVGASVPVSIMIMSILLMGLLSSSSLFVKLSVLALMQIALCLISSFFLADTLLLNKNHKVDLFSLRNFYPSIKNHPNFSLVFLSKLCFSICMAGLKMMPLFYIARFHIREQDIYHLSAFTAAGTLLMLVSGVISGFILDRFGYLKTLNIAGNIVIALTMLIFSLSTNITQVISAFFIFYLALGISGSPSAVLTNRVLTKPQSYGKEISLLNSTNNIGSCLIGTMAPSIIAFGGFFGKSDGYAFFFFILAVLASSSAIFISKVKLANNSSIN